MQKRIDFIFVVAPKVPFKFFLSYFYWSDIHNERLLLFN